MFLVPACSASPQPRCRLIPSRGTCTLMPLPSLPSWAGLLRRVAQTGPKLVQNCSCSHICLSPFQTLPPHALPRDMPALVDHCLSVTMWRLVYNYLVVRIPGPFKIARPRPVAWSPLHLFITLSSTSDQSNNGMFPVLGRCILRWSFAGQDCMSCGRRGSIATTILSSS